MADLDQPKRELAAALGAQWIEPGQALGAEVDVLAPCALGGTLSELTVPRLRCRIVAARHR